jgi:hypothetical protein
MKNAVSALTVLVLLLLLGVVWLLQLQREHRRDFVRLEQCVAVLERNQGAPAGQPIPGCPID